MNLEQEVLNLSMNIPDWLVMKPSFELFSRERGGWVFLNCGGKPLKWHLNYLNPNFQKKPQKNFNVKYLRAGAKSFLSICNIKT